ncbi:uncharacterized protein METZ01_LOCUS285322 [marine metagenome]|uniref:Uncharacterized protein n=1 Tax=marine metagenome TaxID=408172 RepID=A0A382L697_9ZZZZ
MPAVQFAVWWDAFGTIHAKAMSDVESLEY